MDLNFTPEESAFRQQVRQFMQDKLPADIRDRMSRDDASQISQDITRCQKILHAKGWGAPAWPVEFGGTGWDKTRQYIFENECALADAPAAYERFAAGAKLGKIVLTSF